MPREFPDKRNEFRSEVPGQDLRPAGWESATVVVFRDSVSTVKFLMGDAVAAVLREFQGRFLGELCMRFAAGDSRMAEAVCDGPVRSMALTHRRTGEIFLGSYRVRFQLLRGVLVR